MTGCFNPGTQGQEKTMPDDAGYPEDERGAVEALLEAAPSTPDEFLAKLEELGFKLEKSGGMGDGDSPDMDAVGEEPEEEVDDEGEEEGPKGLGLKEGKSPGLMIALSTRRSDAAGKALKKHGYEK